MQVYKMKRKQIDVLFKNSFLSFKNEKLLRLIYKKQNMSEHVQTGAIQNQDQRTCRGWWAKQTNKQQSISHRQTLKQTDTMILSQSY